MMQRAQRTILFLLLALLLGACGQTDPQAGIDQSSAKNADGYVEISVDQLAGMMEDKDFTLVNVHIPYEGEIPETDLFIPFSEITDHLEELPARDAPIVLYCRIGGMSAAAAKALVDEGYTNVFELDGGFDTWKAQGRELLDKR